MPTSERAIQLERGPTNGNHVASTIVCGEREAIWVSTVRQSPSDPNLGETRLFPADECIILDETGRLSLTRNFAAYVELPAAHNETAALDALREHHAGAIGEAVMMLLGSGNS